MVGGPIAPSHRILFSRCQFLLLIITSTGESSDISRISSNPPPMVRKRIMEYLTVYLVQLRMRSVLRPPNCKRLTLQHLLCLIIDCQVKPYC